MTINFIVVILTGLGVLIIIIISLYSFFTLEKLVNCLVYVAVTVGGFFGGTGCAWLNFFLFLFFLLL